MIGWASTPLAVSSMWRRRFSGSAAWESAAFRMKVGSVVTSMLGSAGTLLWRGYSGAWRRVAGKGWASPGAGTCPGRGGSEGHWRADAGGARHSFPDWRSVPAAAPSRSRPLSASPGNYLRLLTFHAALNCVLLTFHDYIYFFSPVYRAVHHTFYFSGFTFIISSCLTFF